MAEDRSTQLSRETVSKYNSERRNMVRGTFEILPDPMVENASVYQFNGLGAFFSGNYYAVSITHAFTQNSYKVTGEAIKQTWDGTATIDVAGASNAQASSAPARPRKAAVVPKSKPKIHVVVEGDDLWDIAHKEYGDANKWTIIEKANHDLLVQRDSRNADGQGHWIYPAMQLVIP